MTVLDLDALEATARAATPGPWGYGAAYGRKWALVLSNGGTADEHRVAQSKSTADAEHIATFDPPTVLALIAEVRRLQEAEAVIARVRALVEPPKPIELGKSMMRSFDRMLGDLRRILATYKPTNQEGT